MQKKDINTLAKSAIKVKTNVADISSNQEKLAKKLAFFDRALRKVINTALTSRFSKKNIDSQLKFMKQKLKDLKKDVKSLSDPMVIISSWFNEMSSILTQVK